jgi:hypothetical protein
MSRWPFRVPSRKRSPRARITGEELSVSDLPPRPDPTTPSEVELFVAIRDAITAACTPVGEQVGTFVFAESYRALVRALVWVASHDAVFDEAGQLGLFAESIADRLVREIGAKRADEGLVRRQEADARHAEFLWRMGKLR